jgi:hypothetical protein
MNCHCEVYPFPHRPLGGKCRGEEIQRRTFEEGWHCAGCTWSLQSEERHPYGEGIAVEYLRECTVDPEHCPAVQAAQERRAAS